MRQLFRVFGRAFQRADFVKTACYGFRKTEIYPFNRNLFKGSGFAASTKDSDLKDSHLSNENVIRDAKISASSNSELLNSDSNNKENNEVATAWRDMQSSFDTSITESMPEIVMQQSHSGKYLPVKSSKINKCLAQSGLYKK